MDEQTEKTGRRKNLLIWILAAAFLLGCILGAVSVSNMGSQGAAQLREYLTDYMILARQDYPAQSVSSVFWSYGRWGLLCVVLGFGLLGVVCMPILFCFRGFLLAFSVGCFVRFWGLSGVVPAFVLFGLTAILWLPGMLVGGFYILSSGAPYRRSNNRKTGVLRTVLLFCLLLSLICAWVEHSLFPVLLPVTARIVL